MMMSSRSFDDIEAMAKLIRKQKGHKVLSSEHALLAVLASEFGRRIVLQAGGSVNVIEKFLDDQMAGAQRIYAARNDEARLGVTREYARCLSKPDEWAKSGLFVRVGITHLFVALSDPEMSSPLTVRALAAGGINIRNVCDRLNLQELAPRDDDDDDFGFSSDDEMNDVAEQVYRMSMSDGGLAADAGLEKSDASVDASDADAKPSAAHDHVRKVLRDLRAAARANEIGAVIGRNKEMADLLRILMRRRKPNALLVGSPGVGKTAVFEGMARHIEETDPSMLDGKPIYSLSVNDLVRGTRYRGDLEDRVAAMVEICEREGAVICIDEAHMLAGSRADGQSIILDAMKPAMARGLFKVVLATTPTELRRLAEDRAFMRRVQRLDIHEPDLERTRTIVSQSVARFSKHHSVSIDADMIEAVLAAAVRHLPTSFFPDKAFDLLDAAMVSAKTEGRAAVGAEDVTAAIGAVSGRRIDVDANRALARLDGAEEWLAARVFGHDALIGRLVRAVRMAAVGLGPEGAPVSAMFVGPTGVGKTETAKLLAERLDMNFRRFDMSEYSEAHAVSRLIGAPPGYVGHSKPGALIELMDGARPSVILFDEIEKAHPDVYDVALQIMDYGRLTGGDGVSVFFEGSILIFSSNCGARRSGARIGFGATSDTLEADVQAALAKTFRPEFLGRIAEVLVFPEMDDGMALKIARSAFAKLSGELSRRGIAVSVDDAALRRVAKAAVSSGYGGREVLRAMRQEIFASIECERAARKVPASIDE